MLLGALLALSAGSIGAARGDANEGVLALGRGDYQTALQIFTPAAEGGDWASQSFLAHTYVLLEDYEKAYAWYYAAAECGSLDARIDLDMLVEQKLSTQLVEKGKTLGKEYHERYCDPK